MPITLLPEIVVTPNDPPVSLESAQPIDNPINIYGGTSQPPMGPDQAKDLTKKIKASIPDLPRSPDEIYSDLTTGREDQLREQAASSENAKQAEKVQNTLVKTIGLTKEPLTPKQVQDAQKALSDASSFQPDTVFEKKYGDLYSGSLVRAAASNENSFIKQAVTEVPEHVNEAENTSSTVVAQRMIAARVLQKALETAKAQPWYLDVVDMGKQLDPTYADRKLRGSVSGKTMEGFGTSLLGSDLERQATDLMMMPLPEYKKRLTEIVEGLSKDNPALAVRFATAVFGRPMEDAYLDNVFNIGDLSMIPGFAKLGLDVTKKAALVMATRRAFKSVTKSMERNESPEVAMAAGAGDTENAAIQKAVDTLAKKETGEMTPMEEALNEATSNLQYDSAAAAANPSRNYREMATRLIQQTNVLADKMKWALTNIQRVERVPALLRTEAGLKVLGEALKEELPGLENQIMDITKPYKAPLGTGYSYDIHIGGKGAVNYTDYETAFAAKQLKGLSSATVEGEGNSFYLKLTRPLDETMNEVRDQLLKIDSTVAPVPKSTFAKFIAQYRTPDEVLSLEDRLQRKTAVYSANVYNAIAKSEAKYIEDLAKGKIKTDPWSGERYSRFGGNQRLSPMARKDRMSQWNRAVKAAQSEINPETLKPGYFKTSPGDLEDFYLQNFKRMPDDVEIEAYFATKRLYEMDHILTNLRVYTNKRRLGVESHSFTVEDAAGQTTASPVFDGVLHKTLPKGGEDGLMYVGGKMEDAEFYRTGNIPPKANKELDAKIKSGELQIVRLHNPDENPFMELTGFDKRIVYVVAKKFDTKPIAWEQVPRQSGGHFVYDADHYIKQAQVMKENIGKVFKHIYTGDTTIMPMKLRAMAQDVADKLDGFRQVLRDEGPSAARQHLKANPIGLEYDEVAGWFNPQKNAETGILHPPKLNLSERIQVVGKDQRIGDMNSFLQQKYQGTWKDGTRSGSLASQYEVQFTGQRDAQGLRTVINKGTATNPLYEAIQAPLLDPIPTLNRALQKMINSSLLDDYKIFAAEHWLQDVVGNHGALKATLEEVRGAPFYHLTHPDWKSDLPKDMRSLFEAQNYQIRQLWGTPSKYQENLHAATQNMVDSIYGKFGEKSANIAMDYAVPFLKDPLSFIRTMTFHAKVGLFAIPQFLVQNATFGQIYAIAPKFAPGGTAATLMKQWSRLNRDPAIIDALDSKLAGLGMGWKPGYFKEALDLLDRNGFDKIFGEHITLDNALTTNIIRNGTNEFLDAGRFFFNEGERSARFGAWFTSYLEHKAANPVGRVTEQEAKKILERADLMTGNMSRASGSALHTGMFKYATQFLSYQLRLAEQMTGHRLTTAEKLRVGAVNAALYGVPAATGLSGLPMVGDYIREGAIGGFNVPFTNTQTGIGGGYVPGEHLLSTTAMEGPLSTFIAFLTGKGNLTDVSGRVRTGDIYNIGPRYGNSGLSIIRDTFREDSTIWKLVGGAPYGVVANTISNADPFIKSQLALLTGDSDKFPMNGRDMVQILNEISSVKSAWRLEAALHTGRWLSSKEVYLEDTSPLKAWFMTVTGLQNQRVEDLQTYRNIHADINEREKFAFAGYSKEYRRYLQALKDGNPDQASEYGARAKFYLTAMGVPETRQVTMMDRAREDNMGLIRKTDWETWMNPKNVTSKQAKQFEETYQAIRKTENEKRQ